MLVQVWLWFLRTGVSGEFSGEFSRRETGT